MTHSEQEEIVRRALHAVADVVEPAADGLERIRERLSRPHPLAVAWLMAGWTGLAQPLLLRMEPALAGAAGRLSGRLGEWLQLVIRSLGVALERLRPVRGLLLDAIRMLRPGSGMSRHEKLRSAIAFGAAALIGAAGGFALSAGLPQQMISAASSFISPSTQHHAGGHGHNSGLSNSVQPIAPASNTAPSSTGKATPTPSSTCTPTPTPSVHPTSTPTSSGSTPPNPPSPTPSPTQPTPTQPSPTAPTPTGPTPSQSLSGVGASPAVINAPASADNGAASPALTQHPLRTAAQSLGVDSTGAATTPAPGASAKAPASAGPSSC
jgi:hypothetical protein